ncbi:MAG: membrane dipeptidase [Patescibacteria group bacterium]|nr:membrane dipeptidase [Patescibacteria group bacterium]
MKSDFIFDLHLDLEVYFNKNLNNLLNIPSDSLLTFKKERHFDLIQAKKAKIKFIVSQIQSLKYDLKNKKLKIISNLQEFIYNYHNFINKLKIYPQFKIIKNFDNFNTLKLNQIGIFLGVEGLYFVKKLKDLEILWNLGIRVFGLTWNFKNRIAGGLDSDERLTSLGKSTLDFLVKREGIIDCAHLNYFSANEVIKLAPKNFIFSHNNLKSIFNFKQNLNQKILNRIKNKQTLIGLTLLPPALSDISKNKPTFQAWIKNYKKLIQINPKIVAIGTDYFGFNFVDSPQGAKNYLKFRKSLVKYKVKIDKIFLNTLNYFQSKIEKW